MIPDSNVQNLMLKEEVVDAVKAGKFNVYSVKTIDEGIEVLTGTKAGATTSRWNLRRRHSELPWWISN